MEWKDSLVHHFSWSEEVITNREGKEMVARKAAEKVRDGDVIGLGSGSTVYLTLFAIAERIRKENLHIVVIPSSVEISMTCMQLSVPQTTLPERRPDRTFDGADEADPDHNLIKGRGGALFKEKLLISSSAKTYILVDQSKLVDRLGTRFPVPVEVFPGALSYVEERLRLLGATEIVLRLAKGKDGPVFSENGNLILDVRFDSIGAELEKNMKIIPGVIESGLFMGYRLTLLTDK